MGRNELYDDLGSDLSIGELHAGPQKKNSFGIEKKLRSFKENFKHLLDTDLENIHKAIDRKDVKKLFNSINNYNLSFNKALELSDFSNEDKQKYKNFLNDEIKKIFGKGWRYNLK